MSDVSLPFGPWSRIASAQWSGHPVSVYTNAENLVLLTVFDKTDEKVNGILVLLKRPLLVDGRTDAFATSQKKELTFVEKISSGKRVKFLLLEATPYYVPYNQSELVSAMQRQHQELEGSTRIVMDAGATFDFQVREPTPRDPEMEVLFGDPLTLFSLSGAPHESAPSAPKAGRLLLGLDADAQDLFVPVSALLRTKVLGKTHLERQSVLQAIIEGVLSAGVSALVFDASGVFSGLQQVDPAPKNLEKFALSPLGAPVPLKAFAPGKGLLIDLRAVDIDWFCMLLGVNDPQIRGVLNRCFSDASSLVELVQRVEKMTDSRDTPQYAIQKTLRALRVIQKAFPSAFGATTAPELKQPWASGFGQVLYVSLRGMAPELSELLCLSLLRSLEDPPYPAAAMVVFDAPASTFSSRILHALSPHVALAASCEHETDVPDEATLELDVLEKEVIVSQAHQAKKRVTFRPLFSRFSQTSGLPPNPKPQ